MLDLNAYAWARSRLFLVGVAPLLACRPEEGASTATATGGTGMVGASEGTGNSVTGSPDGATSTAAPTTGGADLPPARACNGHAALCERRFDEVVFPCTHNAFAARDDGFQKINANQRHGVARQLDDGVRCLMLDVSDDNGTTVLCHGGCALGRLEHATVLADIAAFLADHPDEVLTIIYQDDLPVDRIVADLTAAGLSERTYTHATGATWPTLGSMIDANTRLFVTAEVGGPPPPWFHHVWDLTWDTPYTFHGVDEFNCDLNRGSNDNDLFLVNHWLSTVIDTPSEADAGVANTYDVLYGRAKECQRVAAQVPNFVAVDFYDVGDLFKVVRALNGLP
jgi:hypothetical protein